MKTNMYFGNVCITSIQGANDCNSTDSTQYDVISIGTSADHSPEAYANEDQVRHIRMFGCVEAKVKNGQMTAVVLPCKDLFEINQVQ